MPPSRAEVVDGSCDPFLACTGLALDENGAIGRGHNGHVFKDSPECQARSDQVVGRHAHWVSEVEVRADAHGIRASVTAYHSRESVQLRSTAKPPSSRSAWTASSVNL